MFAVLQVGEERKNADTPSQEMQDMETQGKTMGAGNLTQVPVRTAMSLTTEAPSAVIFVVARRSLQKKSLDMLV